MSQQSMTQFFKSTSNKTWRTWRWS